MELYQPKSGYCFNSDSIFLYDFIMNFTPKGDLLDVGVGCGVLGLLIGRDTKVTLYGVEKQEIFIKYASKNADENKIPFSLWHGDFLSLETTKKYDFIVSNPPFYHDGVQKSDDIMLLQARYSSNLPMSSFFKKVSSLLKPKGHFIFCYDPSQFGLICSEIENVNMKIVDVRFVHPKKDKKASLVMIHARNNSKSMASIWAPLIAFDKDEFSDEVKKIYKKARTNSIKCVI